MDAPYLPWRKMFIEASSDSERKMTGIKQAVITRIQRVANPGFIRIWYGAHQLYLCIHLFYLAIPDTFYASFTSFVAFLPSLVAELYLGRSKFLLLLDTR